MQAQTQTVTSKSMKKIVYISFIVGALSLVVAYIAGSIYYKFILVDSNIMGTLFYSWRVEGADDSALKEKADKISGGTSTDKMKELFKIFANDSYPIHLPRLAANHVSLAYPNMQLMYGLRKMIVEKQNEFLDMKAQKKTYDEFSDKVSATLFFTNHWEKGDELKSVIEKYYNTLDTDHKKLFKTSIANIISLYINLVESSDYAYNGTEPSEKAVEDLAKIISNFKNTKLMKEPASSEGKLLLADFIQNNKDVDIFQKSIKIHGSSETDLPVKLSQEFFKSLTNGVLYPYFSLGYSTMLNTFLYLCLDMKNLEYDKNPKVELDKSLEAIAIEQKMGSNMITAFGSAIAYGVAKCLSPENEIGVEYVKSVKNPIVFALFTSKLATPSESTKKNLKTIIDHLKQKKTMINELKD